MKILMVANWFYEYVIHLCNALSEKDDVTILFTSLIHEDYIAPVLDELVGPKIKIRTIEYPRLHSPKNLCFIWKYLNILRELKPDIVHFQQHPSAHNLIQKRMAEFLDYRIVFTIHDVFKHLGEESGIQQRVMNSMLKDSDATILHGEFMKQQTLNEFDIPKNSMHTIFMGDLSAHLAPEKPLQELDRSGRTVLFFGRIKEYKGLETLIKAEPLISEKVPGVRIIIAGSGDMSRERALMINHDNFEVHNRYLDLPEVQEFIQMADIVVLPYLEASQSGVIPTVYSHGRPVIATRVGSIPEVLTDGHEGLLVEPGDPEQLAEAVIRLLRDDELRLNMAKNAYDRSQTDLSWPSIALKTRQVYSSLL